MSELETAAKRLSQCPDESSAQRVQALLSVGVSLGARRRMNRSVRGKEGLQTPGPLADLIPPPTVNCLIDKDCRLHALLTVL